MPEAQPSITPKERLSGIRDRLRIRTVCPVAHPDETDQGHMWRPTALGGADRCPYCGLYRKDAEELTDDMFLLALYDGAVQAAQEIRRRLEKAEAERLPERGDAVERWLTDWIWDPGVGRYRAQVISDLLDDYRRHADARAPLGEHETVKDCDERLGAVGDG